MNNKDILEKQLHHINIKAICKKEVNCCRYHTYYFDLLNKGDILTMRKKSIEDYLFACNHTSIKYNLTDKYDSCFSLSIEKDFQPLNYHSLVIKEPSESVNNVVSFIGLDDTGDIVKIDFGDTPHLLIAGTTGSGKSVLLNTIISSIYHTTDNKAIEFYCVDTKRIDFQRYKGLDNFVLINEPRSAISVLRYVVEIMELRYKQLQTNSSDSFKAIFFVVDELADLMYLSKAKVEEYIVRLSQKARACNIHLILATQRPIVKVISGLIKANITTRIGLKMASAIDSVCLFDKKGCEDLLGKGDALINDRHFQVAYTSDNDFEMIKSFRKEV